MTNVQSVIAAAEKLLANLNVADMSDDTKAQYGAVLSQLESKNNRAVTALCGKVRESLGLKNEQTNEQKGGLK